MPTTKKRILIVEDDSGISRILELKLKQAGYATTLVNDGEAALLILKKEKFDLMLLDLRMPGVDGFMVLQAMRKRKDKTPVIVCSVLSQDADIQRARTFGIVDYIVKVNVPLQSIVDRIDHFFKTGNDAA